MNRPAVSRSTAGAAGLRVSDSVDFGAFSHIGERPTNQDAVCLPTSSPNQGEMLFAVADGMGGHPGGRLASQMACEEVKRMFPQRGDGAGFGDVHQTRRRLCESVFLLDRKIRLAGRKADGLEDMGTTFSCLAAAGNYSVIVHVGDSRIYRLRKGYLTCLTVDHTFVQDMIFEGEVDPDKAHLHPLRHMLTRALGTEEALDLVDSRWDRLDAGDRFLLCTDGLYNAVSADCLRDRLAGGEQASVIAEKLVNQALNNGTRDNATAIVLKF